MQVMLNWINKYKRIEQVGSANGTRKDYRLCAMNHEDPIVLTLQLDEVSFQYFNNQRQLYFPPERNFLKAHLTLFHHLPSEHFPQVQQVLEQAAQELQPLPLKVTAVKSMGKGVAYTLESHALQQLHLRLQQRWQPWLTAQDKQKLWPHVTVQNKVLPQQAKALQAQLQEQFSTFTATGIGFQVWAYKGGPWELLQEISFIGVESL